MKNQSTINLIEEDPKDQDLHKTVKELKIHVDQLTEQLAINNDITQHNFNIISEIIKIMSDLPIGRQIVNRAINRCKLSHLTNVILPRRKKALKEIETDTSMPEGIRNSFIRRELSMIHSSTRAIHRRQKYELDAAKKVTSFFDKVSDFFNKNRRKLPVLATHKDKH